MTSQPTDPPIDPATGAPIGPSEGARVRRLAKRAHYDRATIEAILDAGLIAHVGTVRDGLPVVVPMLYARVDDGLMLHGSPASGTFRRAREQAICVTITLLDGLVLARSAFHHSVDYRSVVVHGRAEVVDDEAERWRLLDAFMERLVPGRAGGLRPMTAVEVRQTGVLRLSLEQASAKVRTGPPVDDEADYPLPIWAGVLPISSRIGDPEPDPRLEAGIEPPDDVSALVGHSIEDRARPGR